MEFLETTIGRLANYNEYLYKHIKQYLRDNVENDERLKIFNRIKKIIDIISSHFYKENQNIKYLEGLLNEIYIVLRKINFSVTDYESSSYFFMDKMLNEIIKILERYNYIVLELYKSAKNYNIKNKGNIPKTFKPKRPLIKDDSVFLLSIKKLQNHIFSCENLFSRLTLYKDKVYYIETQDMFNFFYFYRTEDCWFWSPPKKTDKEDLWIECPDTKIEKGYWKYQIIPPFIGEFIMWLDFFFPKAPDEYIKDKKDKKEAEVEVKKDSKEKKDNCIVF